jgi:DNA gyrase subunit A
VEFSEFSSHGRGTGGQRIYTVTEKTGELVGCVNVLENEEIMCITSQGKSIKLKVSSIRIMGRTAQGVKILSIDKPDFVIGVDRIVKEDLDIRPAQAEASAKDEAEPGQTGEEPDDAGPEDDAGNQGELF